jgi:dTMP kinase
MLFITFEGMEGCGKTTQIKRLIKRLKQEGVAFAATFEPGGTEIGRNVRKILLDSRNRNMAPITELLLYESDRAQHVEEVIKPALAQGMWVLCDRFYDATVVYQGFARGQDMKIISLLNDLVTQGISPDRTYLLDCPVSLGLARALERNQAPGHRGQDRFERENLAFHRSVRAGYLELAAKHTERFVVLNAEGTEDEIEAVIFRDIQTFLPKP